ncbi:MAG: DEAD/DEAH box helicase [Candidatus Hadarchaeota archaeon]
MEVFKLLVGPVRDALADFGISSPTAPQEMAIPAILSGKNLLLIAPTGTGKTEAALLPIFSLHLSKEKQSGIKIIYIAPLRALNRDLLNRLEGWGKKLGISISVRHGDTPVRERQKQAARPPDMLITTPETLQAILPGKVMKKHLRGVRWVVVDEIHELAEDKRGAQLTVGLERLVGLAGEFQRVGLSATVGSAENVAAFLSGAGRDIEISNVSVEKTLKIEVESPMPSLKDAELSEKIYSEPTLVARLRRMRELVTAHERTLIFVNTRETAEMLGSRLRLLEGGLPIGVHHGSLARDVRIEAEQRFREGEINGLICTSSMELGIDIGAVDLVLQYMSPRQVVRLVQRVGRSGHRVGQLSKGLVIATSPDDIAEAAVIARKTMAGELEGGKIHELALDVMAHQLVGICLDKGGATAGEAMEILSKAHPFRDLQLHDVNSVLEQLKAEGILFEREGKFKTGRGGIEYYFSNLSMIPDSKRYTTRNIASGKSVAALDEEFVASYVEPGATFICKGETWRAVEVDHDRATVSVEEADEPVGAIPAWEGELIPVPFEVAREVGMLRARVEKALKAGRRRDAVSLLADDYSLSQEAAGWFLDEISDCVEGGAQVPTDDVVLMETGGEFVVVHMCFGSLVNNTIGWVLGSMLSARLGTSVAVKIDPYRVALRFPGEPRPDLVEEALRTLSPGQLRAVTELTMKNSSMFKWRLVHVAKRFGAIKRGADLSSINLRRLVGTFEGTPIYSETIREIMLEKLDLPRAEEVLKKIHLGDIKVIRAEGKELTPLAWIILDELSGGEIVTPKRAEKEILASVKLRLEQKGARLHCMNCNQWTVYTRVKRLPDPVECKKCGARLVTVLPFEYRKTLAAIKKKAAGVKLTEAERRLVEKAVQSATLLLTYGKKAVIALSGRGVGPSVATRILAKRPGGDDLYRAILKAEKTYARTRRFWD